MNLTSNLSSDILEQYIHFHPAHIVTLAVVACLGMVCNIVSICVWCQEIKAKSGAFFLLCLSSVDAVFCLTVIVLKEDELKALRNCYSYIVEELALIFSLISRHITVGVGFQRLMVVSMPLSVGRLCSLDRQLMSLACLLLPVTCFSVFGIIVRWWMYTSCIDNPESVEEWIIDYAYLHEIILFSFHIVFFVFLVIPSVCLLYSLLTIAPMQNVNTNCIRKRDFDKRMTSIVLCLSSVSLLETCLSLIYYIFFIKEGYPTMNLANQINIVIYQWVNVVNSTINFVFYSCLGKGFRNKLRSDCNSIVSCLRNGFLAIRMNC